MYPPFHNQPFKGRWGEIGEAAQKDEMASSGMDDDILDDNQCKRIWVIARWRIWTQSTFTHPFILANGRYRWAYCAWTKPRPSIDEVFGTWSKLQGARCKLGGVVTTSVVMRCTSVDFVAIYSEWLKKPIAEQNSCEMRWKRPDGERRQADFRRQGPECCDINFWSESMRS